MNNPNGEPDYIGDAAPDQPGSIRKRAEEILRSREQVAPASLGDEETGRIVHELRVHQIELEMQNEELRRTQEELEASRARYMDLYDYAPVGYVTVNEEGRIIEANLPAADLLGVARGKLINQRITHFILPADQDIYYLHHKTLLERAAPQTCELRLKQADRPPIWVRMEATRITGGDSGSPAHFHIVMSDVTGRKRAEDALRESEARYRTFISVTMDGIYRLDLDPPMPLQLGAEEQVEYILAHATIAEFHPAFAKMYGHSKPEDMTGKKLGELPDGLDHPMNRETIRKFIASNYHVDREEVEEIGSTGLVRHYYCNAIGIVENDALVHVWGMQDDISVRKRAEAEHEKLQAQLTHAQKMESVGRLAGGVAHDFNNMLVVILGHTEMALEQIGPDHPLHEDLEEIRKAGERSANLTRQLLAFARKQTIAPKVLDLNETVERMLKMLRRLIGEDVKLAWLPGKNLWPVKIDPSQMDQILANLCVNARDAISGVGRLTIETGNITFDEDYCAFHREYLPGEYIQMIVSDDGCGMDKNTLQYIFEPFFTTKDVGEGTGLGLAMVYGIVKQNDGFINVYSEPGLGTTFRIYLPRHVGETEPSLVEHSWAAMAQGHESILLVEDEASILHLTSVMLKRLGYTVLEAHNAAEAIGLAETNAIDIDLLMTDVVMPEMNGGDLAIRMSSIAPHLKRLFMSGYPADAIAHCNVLEDGVHFIQKPFSMKTLAAKVREALDQ